ncbi:hypothetical protein AB2N04_11180 [Nitratireductor sp. GISD-1A_MAKvit]|uniref:hypothetical protein n=1 Tax=Nitratireductor sp. GISD-1A_MAKvit TaxID=3234198 RepID=UPI0034664F33
MTNSPHPRSFLAFACYVKEQFDRLDALSIRPVPVPEAQRVGYYPWVSNCFWQAYRKQVAERFAAALPTDWQHTPAAGALVDHQAALELRAAGLMSELDAAGIEAVAPADEWKPARETVRAVAVGVFLTDGRALTTETAHFLNRGIPRMDERGGYTGSNVRDAIDGYVRAHIRLLSGVFPKTSGHVTPDTIEAARRALFSVPAYDVRLYGRLWSKAIESGCSKLSVKDAERLLKSGELLQWRLGFEAEAEPDLPASAESNLYARAVKLLKGRLERLAA